MVLEQGPEKPRRMSPDEILLSTNHIKEIIYADPESLLYDGEPIEVQFKNVISSANAKIFPEMQKQFNNALIGYLNAPAIIDDFVDDRDRNELENNVHDLSREGSALYKSNRLRITNIRHVIQLSDLMTFMGILNEEQKEQIKEQIKDVWAGVADRSDETKRQDNFEQYDSISVLDKVTFTRKVADLARQTCIKVIESQKK